MVTFYTSYLKAYHPTEFMAALLTSEKDNTDKVVKYVDEAKRLGIGRDQAVESRGARALLP
jgi:DNA polymerase-3 subunit alpha